MRGPGAFFWSAVCVGALGVFLYVFSFRLLIVQSGGMPIWSILSYFLSSLVFFASGIFAAVVRPGEKLIRQYFFFCIFQAMVSLQISLEPISNSLNVISGIVYDLLGFGYPLNVLFAFAVSYKFPPGVSISRFWFNFRYPLETASRCSDLNVKRKLLRD